MSCILILPIVALNIVGSRSLDLVGIRLLNLFPLHTRKLLRSRGHAMLERVDGGVHNAVGLVQKMVHAYGRLVRRRLTANELLMQVFDLHAARVFRPISVLPSIIHAGWSICRVQPLRQSCHPI